MHKVLERLKGQPLVKSRCFRSERTGKNNAPTLEEKDKATLCRTELKPAQEEVVKLASLQVLATGQMYNRPRPQTWI